MTDKQDHNSHVSESSKPQDASTSPSPNPNDLDSLWAPMPLVQTRTQVLAMRAGPRPPKDKFFRILPFTIGAAGDVDGYKNCRPVYLFEYQFDGDLIPKTFYVRPGTEVASVLAERDRIRDAILVLGVVRHGSHFVWELKIPNGRNESGDKWAHSRIEIAQEAESKWLKPVANTSAGGYDYDEPMAQYEGPDWAQIEFGDAIQAACKHGHFNDSKSPISAARFHLSAPETDDFRRLLCLSCSSPGTFCSLSFPWPCLEQTKRLSVRGLKAATCWRNGNSCPGWRVLASKSPKGRGVQHGGT